MRHHTFSEVTGFENVAALSEVSELKLVETLLRVTCHIVFLQEGAIAGYNVEAELDEVREWENQLIDMRLRRAGTVA